MIIFFSILAGVCFVVPMLLLIFFSVLYVGPWERATKCLQCGRIDFSGYRYMVCPKCGHERHEYVVARNNKWKIETK